MRVFAAAWVAFVLAMNIWAGALWATEGPPPALAYVVEACFVIVGFYIVRDALRQ